MTAAVIATQLTTPDTTRSYTVTVNSATDLQSIYHRSLVLEDQGTNVKATTSFEIRGVTLASLPNVRGQALLEIYDHVSDSMAFRGVVDSHEPDQQGTLDVIKIIASDHTSLLDNVIPFEARPAGESDNARLGYLWGKYAGSYLNADFSQVQQVSASLPAQVFAGVSLRQAIDMIAAQASTSAFFYLDRSGRLHYGTSESNDAPFNVTSDTPGGGEIAAAAESLRIDWDSKSFFSKVYVRGKTDAGSGWVQSEAAKLNANGLERSKFLDAPDCTTEAMRNALGNMYLGRLNAAKARGSFTVFSPDAGGTTRDGWRAGQNVNVRSSHHDVDQTWRIARVRTSIIGKASQRRYDVEFGNARAGSDSGDDPPIVMGQTLSGDLVDDNGALLLSSSPNAWTGGLGPALRRYITSGLYNSDFALAPPAPDSAIVNVWNPLPFWTFTQSSGSAIFAYSYPDITTGSGRVARFDMTAGAADDEAYIEQIAPINSSTNRAYSVSPYAYVEVSAQSADCEVFLTLQFLQNDGETATGSEYSFTRAATAASFELGLTSGGPNTAPPADAYFARVRYGIQRRSGGSNTATATVDFAETMILTADPRTHIAEVTTPATWTRGNISQLNGLLSIVPHSLTSSAAPTFVPAIQVHALTADGSTQGRVSLVDSGISTGGTAFPTTPATDEQYFRTDLDMWAVYDGTRWLSTEIFVAYGVMQAVIPWAVSGNLIRFGLWQPTYSVYLLELRGSTTVVTTNDGSNYWTVTLKKGSDNSTIGSFTTAADTVAVDTDHLLSVNAVSTEKHVYISGDKTSAPGDLYPFLHLTYRLVLT